MVTLDPRPSITGRFHDGGREARVGQERCRKGE